jgi:nucleotide-binding universal stress UspA family protein
MLAYRKTAVASNFSPTHRAVLAEAANFALATGAQLHVLHAAERTKEKESRFRRSFESLEIQPEILWLEGERPAETLIQAVRKGGYDLLVAGALERDPNGDEKAFTGSVARRLLIEAPCDVLLLPRPSESPAPFRSAFFAVETGCDVIGFIKTVVEGLGFASVTIATADTPFAAAMATSRGEQPVDPLRWAEEVADAIASPELEADARVIDSNTGFGVCDAAQNSGADVMIVRGRRTANGIALPQHLDWLRQVIPMRLLLCGVA